MAVFRFYNEIRRAMQVFRVIFDLTMDLFVSRLYQPLDAAGLSWFQRFLAGLVRRILGRQKTGVGFPVHFRRALERLGPTYVKFGQLLSLRDDMLPERITKELRKLQNQVPPMPFSDVKAVIEEEFQQPLRMVFKDMEEAPVAAASLAQAHMARLRNGRKVIVKVQRPGIVKLIISDIQIMRRVAALMDRIPGLVNYSSRRFVEEFADYTMRELDFTQEAKNADQFTQNFKDHPSVIFPKIYWENTTRRVLTMQYIDGINPDDTSRLKKMGIDGKKLSKLGAEVILKMLFQDGFFHADPHPGNVIVVGRSKMALIDLGITGTFSKETRREMMLYYYYMVMKEYEVATKHFLNLVQPGPKADTVGFQMDLTEAIKMWSGASFKDYSMGRLIIDTLNLGARHHLYFPSELVLSSKAILTIEALGSIFDPDMDLAEISKPIMESIFREQFSPLRLGQSVMNSLPEYLEFIETLPQNMLKTINMISSGRLQVELAEDQKLHSEKPQTNYNPLFAASTLLAGTYFAVSENTPGPVIETFMGLTGMPVLTIAMFVISGYFMFRSYVKNRKTANSQY